MAGIDTAPIITDEKRDELRDELSRYDPEMMLFDGRTAQDGLRLVINANYTVGQRGVVYDGAEEARLAHSRQQALFE